MSTESVSIHVFDLFPHGAGHMEAREGAFIKVLRVLCN